jgi:[ribosomal protein S5]-alanine N-acetyltransferase
MRLPPYEIFPCLGDEKILLRQVEFSELNELIEISFYDQIQAKTLQEAEEMQVKINKDYFNGNAIQWGIVDKLTNKIVGTFGYHGGLDKGEGELGAVLLPQYQGKGYMAAALKLAIDFGINQIGLHRILALTTKQNERAIKLLTRLHFVKVAELEGGELEYELSKNKSF